MNSFIVVMMKCKYVRFIFGNLYVVQIYLFSNIIDIDVEIFKIMVKVMKDIDGECILLFCFFVRFILVVYIILFDFLCMIFLY